MQKEWIEQLPKVDLHCHLDGSISIDAMELIMKDYAVKMSSEEIRARLQASEDCTNLTEYLQKFDLPLKYLQSEKALRLATHQLLKDAANENIRYIEVRFAPMSHVNEGLSCKNVIESVLSGLEEAKKQYNIQASVIVCAMRHYSLKNNMDMLTCAREYLNDGVCALDLAGDEIAHPTREQRELFIRAKELHMPFTIHSGECGNTENIREALALGAKRIGHGIAMKQDIQLMKECRDQRIGIEMCPTSNIQTKAVRAWKEYPLNLYLDQGLLATINTDNRTVSNTDMNRELLRVSGQLESDEETMLKLLHNAVEISFADDSIKHNILKELGAF
ncbi:adenosine deaminase [Anaeromicropila herbilytica]|uniref:adenosine deaminase n=1 Tax=Anaeromicropila herbilytica TaxID=2785025 RepID=A0A7R7EJN9_9FIRM|nr:adenosine deaminase [Anaeromicropila herbilytica]BCN30086.1 adenosine deaminase [Anaeromicropila herbilytica]